MVLSELAQPGSVFGLSGSAAPLCRCSYRRRSRPLTPTPTPTTPFSPASRAGCLWPHYNCCSIRDPEPTRVNLSPTGASGTACRQWNRSSSRLHPPHDSCWPRVSTASPCTRTPGEVGQGESRAGFFVCLFWPNGRYSSTLVHFL